MGSGRSVPLDRSRGFTQTEADLVETVCELVAVGLRISLVRGTLSMPPSITGPAAIVVGADNQLRSVTSAARQRIEELGGMRWSTLPMTLTAMTAAARAYQIGSTVVPRARIRTRSGDWLFAHAAALTTANGHADDVIITLENAGAPEIVPLIVASFGLTNREEDLAALVLQGVDTAGISQRLHLSPYTVQDHLKSVFVKAGVNSRRELTAKVFSSSTRRGSGPLEARADGSPDATCWWQLGLQRVRIVRGIRPHLNQLLPGRKSPGLGRRLSSGALHAGSGGWPDLQSGRCNTL